MRIRCLLAAYGGSFVLGQYFIKGSRYQDLSYLVRLPPRLKDRGFRKLLSLEEAVGLIVGGYYMISAIVADTKWRCTKLKT